MSENHAEEAGKLSFPCQVGIKAMGRQSETFPDTVREIVTLHVEEDALVEVRIRSSKAGRYLSVTCEVRLDSRSQMEAIYGAMHEHPDILMTL